MRFSPDPSQSLWLRDFIPDADNFDWDDGNRSKNLKHGVSTDEIESIFRQERGIFMGGIIEPAHEEWRGLVLGQTDGGRRLSLVFTRRGGKLRPISCRAMRAGERRVYETGLQAEGQGIA